MRFSKANADGRHGPTWRAAKTFGTLSIAGVVAVLPLGAAAAQGPASVQACVQCHGVDGQGGGASTPVLAGQRNAYLARQLKDFKAGTRKHDLMNPIAAQLNDTEIGQLALYFSRIAPAPAAHDAFSDTIPTKVTWPDKFDQEMIVYHRDETIGNNQRKTYWINRSALAALKETRPLPEGSVIVSQTEQVETGTEGMPTTARTTGYAVMRKGKSWGDAVPQLLRNGDWHYGLFDDKFNARKGNHQGPCLACHLPVAADDFIFTRKALDRFAQK
jgi:cytochrome c553